MVDVNRMATLLEKAIIRVITFIVMLCVLLTFQPGVLVGIVNLNIQMPVRSIFTCNNHGSFYKSIDFLSQLLLL